jgi:hypothetical protein
MPQQGAPLQGMTDVSATTGATTGTTAPALKPEDIRSALTSTSLEMPKEPEPTAMAAPAQTKYTLLNPNGQSVAERDYNTYIDTPNQFKADRDISNKTEADISNDAQISATTGQLTSQLYNEISKLPEGGILSGGPYYDLRSNAVKAFNQVIRTIDPSGQTLKPISEADIAAGTAAAKIAGATTFAQTSGANQNSLGALDAARAIVANPGITKPEVREIVAGNFTTRAKAMDRNLHLNEWKQNLAQTHGGYADLYNAKHADDEFRKTYNDAYYSNVKTAISKILATPFPRDKSMSLYDAYLKGLVSSDAIDQFVLNKNGGLGLKIPSAHRYLTGE